MARSGCAHHAHRHGRVLRQRVAHQRREQLRLLVVVALHELEQREQRLERVVRKPSLSAAKADGAFGARSVDTEPATADKANENLNAARRRALECTACDA